MPTVLVTVFKLLLLALPSLTILVDTLKLYVPFVVISNGGLNVTVIVAPEANMPLGLAVNVAVVAPVTKHVTVAGSTPKSKFADPIFFITTVTFSVLV